MSAEEKPIQLIPDTKKMEYRYLGNSGLRVSVLSFGNWEHDDQRTLECVRACLNNGINFFDTAESYGLGTAEIALGKALKEGQKSGDKKDFELLEILKKNYPNSKSDLFAVFIEKCHDFCNENGFVYFVVHHPVHLNLFSIPFQYS